MRFNVLFGGKAGQGPNILTQILGKVLVERGFYVFYSRDYESLIRGGHNFNILTFSNEHVHSNDSNIDILVALDENTIEIHRKNMKKGAILITGKHENMYFAGKLFKILGFGFDLLEKQLKEIGKRFEENVKEAKKGFDSAKQVFEMENLNASEKRDFKNGSQAVADGAIKSGLDIYYAYPMTPATTLMMELADKQVANNFLVLELENEIAVANAGIGSAITGAKTMVGTSGGGFDLMTEALSLTGIAGVPLVFYLSQRPGPATGVATYNAQGDMNIARHAGHGEFPRIVLAPGDAKESEELTSHAFYFSQKYKIPSIILSDKHIGESFYTSDIKSKLIASKKWTNFGRYNSYEKNSEGSATENPEIVKRNVDERNKKRMFIEQESEIFERFKIYGKRESENVIVSWGSPKGAIIDALHYGDIDAKFVQILYIEPFPKDIWNELLGKNIIIVENNSTSPLNDLLKEKLGFNAPAKNLILRYDGRPFIRDELEEEIKKRLRK